MRLRVCRPPSAELKLFIRVEDPARYDHLGPFKARERRLHDRWVAAGRPGGGSLALVWTVAAEEAGVPYEQEWTAAVARARAELDAWAEADAAEEWSSGT